MDELTPEEIRSKLAQCSGTSNYHQHWLGGKFLYTDGAKAMAELCGAYWLLDIVFSSQTATGIIKYRKSGEFFQVWTLTRAADYEETGAWFVTCEDGDYKELYRQGIPFSDFPLDDGMKLFVGANGEFLVCYLPSED